MLDVPQASASAAPARRVLGQEPAVLGAGVFALLITAGLLLLQMKLRTGIYYPETIPIFYRLFLFEDYPASFLFVLSMLIAVFPEAQRATLAAARSIGERPGLVAVLSGIVFAAGALWVYHAHPLSMDEYAPYLQSQAFAAGSLTGKYPPALLDWLVVPSFQNYFIHVSTQTGEVASSYWPGFALLLVPFTAAGVPWLCNPVLGAASVWVIHRLTLRLTQSTSAAGVAVLLSLASAAFVIDSMSFYSMTAHLLCNAVFVLLLLDAKPLRALAAGVVGGLALTLHNPVPHMLFAIPWLLWLLTRRDRWTVIPAIAAGYLPWIIIVGFGWRHFLQSLAPPDAAAHATGAMSLLEQMFREFGKTFHVPGNAELLDRAIGLGKLWLWAAPLSLVLACAGVVRHRRNPLVLLLLASAVLTFVGYLFVPLNQGHGWGFRYMHSAWFVFPLLAGAAFAPATQDASRSPPTAFANWALAGAIGGLLIITPYFGWQVHRFIADDLAQVPVADHGEARVVLITPTGYYSVDLVQNDPFLRSPVIRMVSHGTQDDKAMMARQFPDLVLLTKTEHGSVWGHASSKR